MGKNSGKTIEKHLEKLRKRISELEKSEHACKELEKENTKLRKILEATKDAIFIISDDGTIVYTNLAMDELFGYKKGELIGKKPSIFNTAHNAVEFMKDKIAYVNEKGYWEGEIRNKKKNGSEFTSYVRAYALRNSGGKTLNIIVTEHDITERNYMKSQLEESLNKFKQVLEETINAIALTIEKRDLFTSGHQHRVAELASAIAKTMNLSEERVTGVYMAGLLHDIGKVNIPAELLMKPAKLTDLEFELVKKHPQVTHDILKGVEFPWPVAKISLQHHERLDGSGYPNGLKGDDIALESRILAVADVVEAMSSARPYRPALGIEKALEEISSKKGLLYDADVVDACIKLFREKGFKFK